MEKLERTRICLTMNLKEKWHLHLSLVGVVENLEEKIEVLDLLWASHPQEEAEVVSRLLSELL